MNRIQKLKLALHHAQEVNRLLDAAYEAHLKAETRKAA